MIDALFFPVYLNAQCSPLSDSAEPMEIVAATNRRSDIDAHEPTLANQRLRNDDHEPMLTNRRLRTDAYLLFASWVF